MSKFELPDNPLPQDGRRWSFDQLQWINGDKNRNKAHPQFLGGFFSQVEIPEVAGAGIVHPLCTQEGGSVPGAFFSSLWINVIRTRESWFCEDENERIVRFRTYQAAKDSGLGKPRSHLQMLVRCKGDSPGSEPRLLSFKGINSSAFQNGYGDSMEKASIPELIRARLVGPCEKHLLKQGCDPKRARLPLACWWVQVGAELNGEGLPIRQKVGTGKATKEISRPVLLSPLEIPENFQEFYVGKDIANDNARIYAEYEEWANEWKVLQ